MCIGHRDGVCEKLRNTGMGAMSDCSVNVRIVIETAPVSEAGAGAVVV